MSVMLYFFTDWTILDEHFSLLCDCLPNDYQSTLVKLKSLPQLSNDDHRLLGTLISSCQTKLVNEKIAAFLIVKLCYNGSSGSLVNLNDVMKNLIDFDQPVVHFEKLSCGKFCYVCCIMFHYILHMLVSR